MRPISEFVVKSEIEMKKLGYSLTNLFQSQDLITFTGDLGVGKTFLSQIFNSTFIGVIIKARIIGCFSWVFLNPI